MEGLKKVVVDTNLLVRYLTEDDQQKADAVEGLLNKAERNEIKIIVPSIVIAELIWVLESFYKMAASEITELIKAVLNTPGVVVAEKAIIASALKRYGIGNIDFIDTWIIEFAKDRGLKTIYTFDKKHFKGIEDLEAISP